jgi:hypothetical protein
VHLFQLCFLYVRKFGKIINLLFYFANVELLLWKNDLKSMQLILMSVEKDIFVHLEIFYKVVCKISCKGSLLTLQDIFEAKFLEVCYLI